MSEINNDKDSKKKRIKEIYRHDEMSNKVLQVDKRLQNSESDPLNDAELSKPKSMYGKIKLSDMGQNVNNQIDPQEVDNVKRQIKKKDISSSNHNEKKNKTATNIIDNKTILEMDSISALRYYPSDSYNNEIYEKILKWTMELLGNDIPHDIILETTDILIYNLKDQSSESGSKIDTNLQVQQNIENDLGISIDKKSFTDLIKLTNMITDYDLNPNNNTTLKQHDNTIIKTNILSDEDVDENDNEIGDLNTLEQELLIEEAEEEETTPMNPINNNSSTIVKENVLDTKLLPNKETVIIESTKEKNLLPVITLINKDYIKRKIQLDLNQEEATVLNGISNKIIKLLKSTQHDKNLFSKKIESILDHDKYSTLIKFFSKNYYKLSWGIILSETKPSDLSSVFESMRLNNCQEFLEEYLSNKDTSNDLSRKRSLEEKDEENEIGEKQQEKKKILVKRKSLPQIIDLDKIKFDQNTKILNIDKVNLPEGSFKKVKDNYDEIHIPAPKKSSVNFPLISISELPDWAQEAFPSKETLTLNQIQSRVYPKVFENDANLLLCAPTGGGKTNVAILGILRALSHFRNDSTEKFNLSGFKAVYIAPLKALVQEQVREFQRRLSYLGIKVSELTGDSRLNKYEITQSHILVSTPEKWDVITRKMDDSSFVLDISLIIIDEIHLLHDTRGPVLENIVSRTLYSRYWLKKPRLLALSATLPNYTDVAKFLRVPNDFVFYFDSSYRPCPLTQQFCGIREQNSLKRMAAMNDACYDKVFESLSNNNQVIIFVHSRKDTARTATMLKNKFLKTDNINKLKPQETGSKEILLSESTNIKDPSLRQLLEYGIGIHHAGLTKEDRSLSEDLFADGLLKVLVSTATLAWGVNLPAHTVIIKGTDVYSPEKGTWEQLSPQDILQMLGRAGRPRYDTHGEGIIITKQSDLQYYLAILNQQLPIESQLVSRLDDSVNAEIVLGNIKSREEAMMWLTYTYLYIRMLVSPALYRVDTFESSDEPTLSSFRASIAHSVLTQLRNQQLIIYNEEDGTVEPTELGRIASYFYIKPESIAIYNRELTDRSTIIDMFRIFSLSDEFKYISIRQEDKIELQELYNKCPIPIKDDISISTTKVNILLQAYISQLKFDGFALNADMIFIQQNAGRLLRAMFELCLRMNWSQPTKVLLGLTKSVMWKMWSTNTPLRQFRKCPKEVIRRAESATLPWTEYIKFTSPSELGQAIRVESYGKLVYDLIQRFPTLKVNSVILPLTPSLLKFELQILPHWVWDAGIHGTGEIFWIFLEDINGREILYADTILIKESDIGIEQSLSFHLQLSPSQQKRLPPTIYISVISERWWHSTSRLPVVLETIKLPKKFPLGRELDEVDTVLADSLGNKELSDIFKGSTFNDIESDVFPVLFETNENILIGCPKGSGKTNMALLAILNHWRQNKGRAVYISTSQDHINNNYIQWNKKISHIAGGKVINKLSDNITSNVKLLAQSHLILATPQQFDALSRNWRKRKNIQRVELFIFDNINEISHESSGYLYENMISRIIFMCSHIDNDIRIVGLSSCLPNGIDLGDWIGVEKENVFNYVPNNRVNPVEIHLQSFATTNHLPYTSTMIRYAFDKIRNKTQSTPSIIYLNSRRNCVEIAQKIISLSKIFEWNMLNIEDEQNKNYANSLTDNALKTSLLNGVGILYTGMNEKDKKIIQDLYNHNSFPILLITKNFSYDAPKADMVIVLGTEYFDYKNNRYVNYQADTISEILGSVSSYHYTVGKLVILTSDNHKSYYKKFISEPAPLESYLYYFLHDSFLNEINNMVITNKQDCLDWLTYTYFYRRIHANPSFYGVTDNSSYGISAYLSELVETTINDMIDLNLIQIQEANSTENEEILSPLNGCLIASHYGVSFLTMNIFIKTLTIDSTLKDILLALSYATEFESIPVEKDDISRLAKIEKILPLQYPDNKRLNIVSYKVFVLLQAYFSRISLSVEFTGILRIILGMIEPLVNAMVDILSGEGFLNATVAMDLSQMIVQAVWDVDSPLKQIPFFTRDILEKCKELNVETVYDVMALEDKDREYIVTVEDEKLIKLANFINNYPNIEMDYSIEHSKFKSGEQIMVHITLRRDDEPETLTVTSECYPYEKIERWWIVIGNSSKRELYALKKVTLSRETQQYDIPFELSKVGKFDLTIWCVCDSYQDADKEISFSIEIVS